MTYEEWFNQKIEDDEFFFSLLDEAEKFFNDFLNLPKEIIKERMKAKIHRGAQEYGNRLDGDRKIKHETEDECIDIPCWMAKSQYEHEARQY